MNKRGNPNVVLGPLFLTLLVGCATPDPVINVAKIAVMETEVLKRDAETYTKSINAAREAAAKRLATMQSNTALRQRRTEEEEVSWQLAENKTAIKMLKELRKQDALLATDVYAIAGIRVEAMKALKAKFEIGRASCRERV